MTSDTVIRDATVLVRDGRIAAVGPASEVDVPAGVTRIDGGGGWVIPGLADMHTHLYSDGVLPDSAAPAELGVMLANGVTTIRLMAGTPQQLELRDAVARGAVLGPQLWVSGPMVANEPGDNVRVVTTPTEARATVRETVAAGYDFVKVTFGITGAVYDALVDEARRAGIRVVGHVEPEVGVRRALAAGQQIEHLDAYFEAALADSAPSRASLTQFGVYRPERWESLAHVDDERLGELARATARAGVWTGPTLHVFNRAFGDPFDDAELHALPDWGFIPEEVREPYVRSRERYWAQPVPRATRRRYAEIRSELVRRIHEAGGRILAGSDAPELLMVYGFALHRELEALVDAGLTPYDALVAATRNPAEFLGAQDEFGTIVPGRRADLVLLGGDPRADITNTRRIEGVMVGGRWLDRERLDGMLEAGRRAIAGGG
jgi:imidazolonepropionase-like amidohydrolase